MRKPATIEYLYLDFDGFFASVEQQARPALRGRPVGVVPFEGTDRTVVIACSKEAKARGVKNVMNVADARALCPEIILQPQTPDFYRRAHNTLIAEISTILPVEAIKSIDELTCRLDKRQIADPVGTAEALKDRIATHVGTNITCSIGFAANRHLAKIACKMDKPNGVTIWTPDMVPEVLFPLPFEDIPGIGSRMERRLAYNRIQTVEQLLATGPKHMRKLWRSVTGERLWYALNGYAVKAQPSDRSMFGHGRVLPPEARSIKDAWPIARMLLIKAARRMRRAGYLANGLHLYWATYERGFGRYTTLPSIRDDQACISALQRLWAELRAKAPRRTRIMRVHVALDELVPQGARQLDMLKRDDAIRLKWESATDAVDTLNARYGRSLVTLGPWDPPKGGHLGGKISYTRIPRAEDFW